MPTTWTLSSFLLPLHRMSVSAPRTMKGHMTSLMLEARVIAPVIVVPKAEKQAGNQQAVNNGGSLQVHFCTKNQPIQLHRPQQANPLVSQHTGIKKRAGKPSAFRKITVSSNLLKLRQAASPPSLQVPRIPPGPRVCFQQQPVSSLF